MTIKKLNMNSNKNRKYRENLYYYHDTLNNKLDCTIKRLPMLNDTEYSIYFLDKLKEAYLNQLEYKILGNDIGLLLEISEEDE